MKLLHDPPNQKKIWTTFTKVPIFGWWEAYNRQLDNENLLVRQTLERGEVSEEVWEEFNYDKNVKEKVDEIVITYAYPEGSTFHPLDPVELMFVLRYGDGNEACIIMDIEYEFEVELGQDYIDQLIEEKTPYNDFINYIEKIKGKTNQKPG